jgi:hypothetical protein
MKSYIKHLKYCFLLTIAGLTGGCAGYLDMIPDNVATLEHAFSTRNVAQRFLFTCYNYLPNYTDVWSNVGLVGSDELWWNIDGQMGHANRPAALLAAGRQNANNPYMNYFDGANNGKNLFIALRDCNIFLENIHIPHDLYDYERNQWIAEVKVLKAYYHFYLMQLYGPIPIIRENLPVNASPEEVRVFRDPVDEVVKYIVELIDEALPDLLLSVDETRASDAGRITQPIAAAIKAKALVLAASPLFNGNPDYSSFVDSRGVQLISSTYDASKWTKAAEAVKEAIDISHAAGHRFYEFRPTFNITSASETTKLKCKLRGAITDKFNSEIVWASTLSTQDLEYNTIPNFGVYTVGPGFIGNIGPTLKIAEEFYSRNGIPINEDEEWMRWTGDNFIQRYDTILIRTAAGSGIDKVSSLSDDHKYYIGSNEITARLHCYREPRFYAWMGFDRGIWEMNGITDDARSHVMLARSGEYQGAMDASRHSTCGYFTKKLVNMETIKNEGNTGMIYTRYTYPIIRLADLYLLYAEALNEANGPGAEVYKWVDSVRSRAGLRGVEESWSSKAIPSMKNKPRTKEGMREIIKRERLIELTFESQRIFDLRRWKDALKYFNEPVRGWSFNESNPLYYYRVVTYWDQNVFNTRDYLWPLKLSTLQTNANLVQNPGW